MAPSRPLHDRNAAVFDVPAVAAWYLREPVFPAERALLIERRADFAGRRALDLGIGTGRTTALILPHASDYLGIDLSPEMLRHARAAFPGADLREMDMRHIGTLETGSRDYVLGACAALDVFDQPERLACIAAIHDVLGPGGLFVFSAHNLAWRLAGQPPRIAFSANPVKLARDLRQLAIGRRNYGRRRQDERRAADHAMLRDMAHQWRMVLYYIDAATQRRQLDELGFEVTDIYGADGRILRAGESTIDDPALHYRARKR